MSASSPLTGRPAPYDAKQKTSARDTLLSAGYWELPAEPEAVDESSNEFTIDVEQLDDLFASIRDFQESGILLPFYTFPGRDDFSIFESSIEILGQSVGGITERLYANPASFAFKAIMT